jgi:GLPGLI family protein
MKTSLTFLFLIVIASITFAQKPDNILARVRYTYSNTTDTLKTGKTRTENMLLFIGKNASLYTSYDKINHEISEDQKRLAKAIAQAGISGGRPTAIKLDLSAGEWLTTSNYTCFSIEKKMVTKENILGLAYLIDEPIPEIKWKISKDTASFSGVKCQKATATFEGKNWVAWFAAELPFQNGPWKLQGLPGLIVDAYSDDKKIQFQFAGFEKAKPDDFARLNDIKKRPNYVPGDISNIDVMIGLDVASAYFDNIIQLSTYRTAKTTRKEFDKLKAAYEKDPNGFMRAQSGY